MSPSASTVERPVSITCVTPWSRGLAGPAGRSRKSGPGETLPPPAPVSTWVPCGATINSVTTPAARGVRLTGRGRHVAVAAAAAAALSFVAGVVTGAGADPGKPEAGKSVRPPGGPVSLVWGG